MKDLQSKIEEIYLDKSIFNQQTIDFDQCQLNLEFFDKFEGGSDYFDADFNNRVETEKRNFEKKVIALSQNIRFKNP